MIDVGAHSVKAPGIAIRILTNSWSSASDGKGIGSSVGGGIGRVGDTRERQLSLGLAEIGVTQVENWVGSESQVLGLGVLGAQ